MIRVIIVEDDPMLAELNRRFVEKIDGFMVVDTANNGEDAVKKIKNHAPNLVILDVYMPKIDGMQVFRKIRNENQSIDFILVTAANDVDKINEALNLGAVDYLVKPFEFDRLKKSLLNYQARKNLLIKNSFVGQKEIDQLFMGEYKEEQENQLKKGLHQLTLKRIIQYLKQHKGELLSSEIISEHLEVSKVTVRRYLEYLEETGAIEKNIEYGSRGRPAYQYRYVDRNQM